MGLPGAGPLEPFVACMSDMGIKSQAIELYRQDVGNRILVFDDQDGLWRRVSRRRARVVLLGSWS